MKLFKKKKQKIQISIPDHVYEYLVKDAKDNGITLDELVEQILRKKLKELGEQDGDRK